MQGGNHSSPTPRATPAREVTFRALLLGVLIGCVMGVANVYLGLKVGMSVSASIPAAVISMGLLRGVLRSGTVLENNIVQTVASAGQSLAAGIIFTMPALIIAGVWTEFDFWTTTLVSITGGLLGVLFMIPLRRPMIVEDDELLYPEGVACAKVLAAGEGQGSGMKLIFGGLFGAALIQIMASVALIERSVHFNYQVGKAYFLTGLTAGPAVIAVGFIVGINIACLVFMGGAISWIVAGPLLTSMDSMSVVSNWSESGSTDLVVLGKALKPHLRFLGVGAMVVGGLWSILMIRGGIARGIRQTMGGYRASLNAESRPDSADVDMGPRWILFLLASTLCAVLLLYVRVTGSWGISALATVLMCCSAFFFVAVAAHIVGLVGASNSPVSGMTICSVLFTSAFVALFGFDGEVAILATMGVAGVVCCAACTSGDVCQDLKTGNLLGATPRRQQWSEILGVVSASFVMWWALDVLHRGGGFEADGPAALEAPQARLFASLMDGFFGDRELPFGLIAIGAGIGLGVILIDQLLLKPRGSRFRMHVMPVAVGMYLPFGLTAALLLGGLLGWLSGRGRKSVEAGLRGRERGVILSSGLIAGEAIAGILVAVFAANEIGLPTFLPAGSGLLSLLTALIIGGMCFILLLVSRPVDA